MSRVRAEFETSEQDASVSGKVVGELEIARQSLTEEMQRLLGRNYQRKNDLIGGIPVDSEYIIFIIDTSGSMFNHGWGSVVQKLTEVLDIYPKVKVQFITSGSNTFI